MKYTRAILYHISVIAFMFVFTGCDDLLDIKPPAMITPDDYLNDDSQLESYSINRYGMLPFAGGEMPYDNGTDNSTGQSAGDRFKDFGLSVGESGGAWGFGNIYECNYFFNDVLPKYEAGTLKGNQVRIEHAIGEMYFFRGLEYFNKLKSLGDFPIVRTLKPDKYEVLVEDSKRMPRTEVARFILSDLDSAFMLMSDVAPDGKRNRLNKDCVKLFRSRVALYEGTWLKYFKDTPFVPNGPGWPGASKEYNKNYQFQSGSIDKEIEFFLGEAMKDADYVASKIALEKNEGIIRQSDDDYNPFLSMFGADDMSVYNEILLWRDCNAVLDAGKHNRPVNGGTTHEGTGLTRSLVQSFLMKDGLPYYASSLYQGDDHNTKIIADRDDRIRLMMKIGGQQLLWKNLGLGTHGVIKEPMLPDIINGSPQFRYSTGFTIRKYTIASGDHAKVNNWACDTGIHIFRAAEAYLNYIEASYELNGNIDAKADQYWKALRTRAGVDPDYNKAIAATDMAKEAELDWGAYSAGQVLSDKTLFNIRRERRNEFIQEGFRMDDVRRWRSMDQIITNRYHVEGFKLWGSDYIPEYEAAGYNFIHDGSNEANVSSPALSDYIRPQEIRTTNVEYNGLKWWKAHYLDPIATTHFSITSSVGVDGGYSDSPIYQNPYWPTVANEYAIE